MDQNQQNFYQPYVQAPPMQKNAAYYRAKAREALKGFYLMALLAFFLCSLLGGAPSSGGSSFSFNFNSSDMEEIPVDDLTQAFESGDFSEIVEELTGSLSPFFAVLIVLVIVAALFGIAFSLFVGSPIKLGYAKFNLDMIDGKKPSLNVLFQYFKKGYGKSVALNLLYQLLMTALSLPLVAAVIGYIYKIFSTLVTVDENATEAVLAVVLIGALLLLLFTVAWAIVVTVISYRYYFCFIILAEYPEMRVIDAFRNSASLMKGNKWRLFCLELSFIGWILLSVFCTCGLGIFFLQPYMQASTTAFYDDIANRAAARETEFPSLNPDDYLPRTEGTNNV